jgi:NADPH-dependent 2,4-dienoyl-CoA reductase/sulfur reductase-like enzyme
LVARTPEEFAKTGIDVELNSRVEGINPDRGIVRISNGTDLPYDILVMAGGAEAVRLGVPGEDLDGVFTLRNLSDALKIKSYLNGKFRKKALIIGAGYIGLEMCEAFRSLGIETVIIARYPYPVPRFDAQFGKQMLDELNKNQVDLLSPVQTLGIEKGNDLALRLVTDQGNIETDLILIGTGIKQNTALAESIGIKMGEFAIKVDFSQRTSREEVYAVGDCSEVFHRVIGKWNYFPLGDVANKQGRTAGRNIGGVPATFPGVVGAQSFKLFGLEAAAAGLTEEEAARYGFQPVSTIIREFPMARSMASGEKAGLKLVADKNTGKLLGAQSVAEKGAVMRINCLSVALWSGMTLEEISGLDLAYSPYFSGSWDAIHIAAQILMKNL